MASTMAICRLFTKVRIVVSRVAVALLRALQPAPKAHLRTSVACRSAYLRSVPGRRRHCRRGSLSKVQGPCHPRDRTVQVPAGAAHAPPAAPGRSSFRSGLLPGLVERAKTERHRVGGCVDEDEHPGLLPRLGSCVFLDPGEKKPAAHGVSPLRRPAAGRPGGEPPPAVPGGWAEP